jgi:hypothetical protein
MDLTDQDEQRLREAKEYLAKHDRKKRKHREEEKQHSSRHKRFKKESSHRESKKESKKKRHKDVKKKTKILSKRTNLGDPRGHPPARLLDAERDYFAYHQHFWVYLYREEQTT